VKTFYSAEDIQALAAAGRRELRVDANTVLTDLARDEARRLGITLVRPTGKPTSSKAVATAQDQEASLGPRPKGCQHGPVTSDSRSIGSDSMVDELVSLVKRLGREE
jgi:hypothetical protein